MKKLFLKIGLFLKYIGLGLKSADKTILSSDNDGKKLEVGGIEQQEEAQSVYKDLLRGEVTQQVKEFRYEMYHAERKSHEYDYTGGGHAKRKNTMLGKVDNIEDSDGNHVQIIQNNYEDQSSLGEFGIHNFGSETSIEENAEKGVATKSERRFTICIDRDFLPKYRIECYTTKLVVKRINNEHVFLDFYISKTPKEFDNVSKLFTKEVEKIYNGERRSDIIEINNVHFVSYKAYGTDNLKFFKYNIEKLYEVIDYQGYYVFRFGGVVVEDGSDLIDEFYDEIAYLKNKNHAPRETAKGATISFDNAETNLKIQGIDTSKEEKLLKDLR